MTSGYVKKRRPALLCLIIALIACCSNVALAAPEEKESDYQTAVALFGQGSFDEALNMFPLLGDYKSSVKYSLYAMGMTALDGGAYADAQAYFASLASRGFLDSAEMAQYAQAREMEDEGLLQDAMDTYARLDVLDSMIRQVTILRALQKGQTPAARQTPQPDPSVELPDPQAQFDQGVQQYEDGDYASALQSLRLAAEQGHALAQYNLGQMYAQGDGTPQDYAEAARWYQLAAEQGMMLAQCNLGALYEDGRGVKADMDTALAWFTAAAEQGDATAQSHLGELYAFGELVPFNGELAFKWFTAAAEQGDPHAQYNLGISYKHGVGVEQNDEMAQKWLDLAAAQGIK